MPLWQPSLPPSTGDSSDRNDCSEIDGDSRPASPFLIDTRASRPPRLLVNVPVPAVDAIVDMAAITATASNPVSPGPPSASQDLEARPHDFVPPTRPSSTPFPQPDQRIDDLRCLGVLSDDEYVGDMDMPVDDDDDDDDDDDGMMDAESLDAANEDTMDVDSVNSEQDDGHLDDSLLNILASAASLSGPLATNKLDLNTLTTPPLSRPSSPQRNALKKSKGVQTLFLQNLPMEIQVLILDYVFECTVSPMMKSWPDKRLTKLACFTQIWRTLIQERLYCRLKLKATGQTLADAIVHFADHPHLRSYVKHVELWFPVFEPKLTRSILPPLDQPSSSAYSLPTDNCSLEEAFFFLSTTFSELSVLTLEGGERKKAPQAHLFSRQRLVGVSDGPALPAPVMPQVKSVRTLVCKGQWNLIRSEADFQHIAAALPNLNDWRGSYSKPKSKSYLSMAIILPNLPTNITSLDLCLEGDFRQEISFPPFFLKVTSQIHFCTSLAKATPALQHLSYTGRVCRFFFDLAATLADPRYTRLKSIELNVKNCCRHVTHWHESGSGATDINFIRAFEALVLSGVRSLEHLNKLEYLRIRYVDLEFQVPPLNPFFLLENGVASGVWSDIIVSELNRVRPNVRWAELSETIGERTLSNGRIVINAEFPKRRVISLKLSDYAFLVALATTP